MKDDAVAAQPPLVRNAGVVPLEVRDLETRFGPRLVQEHVSFTVPAGTIFAVMGVSGCGKSTLIRHVVGLLEPAAGQVLLMGKDYWSSAQAVRDGLRADCGVLFQSSALWSSMTLLENVCLPLRLLTRLDCREREDRARQVLSWVGMAQYASYYPADLSGGMRKRAGLARALALDPELLFLDEPTAGLDPIGAAAFDDLIRSLKETLGLTVFLITHDLDTLHAICDRVAVLADRKVVAIGTIPELLALDHPWIQEYFNGPRGRAAEQASERAQDPAEARRRRDAALASAGGDTQASEEA